VKSGILKAKMHDFRVKWGICEEEMFDFQVNAGFSKGKRGTLE
jgi:hypothetical protein